MRTPEELARLDRIEQLMQRDPPADTPEGMELNKLVDEQIAAERHIAIDAVTDPNGTADE